MVSLAKPISNGMSVNWSKYIITFIITALVFGGAFYLSNSLNNKRLSEIESIQEKLSLDILTSETQFELLREVPCKAVLQGTLTEEVGDLANKLIYTENLLGSDNEEVIRIKKTYFLLEAKDYLLAKRIDEKCGNKPVLVLYFYSNRDCEICRRQGLVLTKLREKYPDIRVYSFDYDFDSPIVETLKTVYEIENNLPAVVIDGEAIYGFYSLENIENSFPEIKKLPLSGDYASSTPKETSE